MNREPFLKFAADVEADADAGIDALIRVKLGVRALVDALPADPVSEPEPPAVEPAPEDPPAEEPGETDGDPAPGQTPPPPPAPQPPATPKPPASTYDAIVALKAKQIDTSGWKSVDRGDRLPAGISVSAAAITNTGYSGDLLGWDIGDRMFVCKTKMGGLQIRSRAPAGNANMSVDLWPGSHIEEITDSEFDGSLGVPKVIYQRYSGTGPAAKIGSLGGIRGSRFVNCAYDLLKLAGSDHGDCIIEGNYLGPQVNGGAGAHFDGITFMAAHGANKVRRNFIDMSELPGQVGVNNWVQFMAYWDRARFDDVEIAENVMLHGNDRSFAIMVSWKNSVQFGPISFMNNWMQKKGGARKVIYGTGSGISRWVGNIDLDTGGLIAAPAGAATV